MNVAGWPLLLAAESFRSPGRSGECDMRHTRRGLCVGESGARMQLGVERSTSALAAWRCAASRLERWSSEMTVPGDRLTRRPVV